MPRSLSRLENGKKLVSLQVEATVSNTLDDCLHFMPIELNRPHIEFWDAL